mgnify:CR=1 FL=1
MSAQELVKLCTRKKRTIASCESLTAGLFSAEIASVSGASKALKGGIVTYFTEIKEKVVGVDTEVISKYGVVSKECADQMAQKTRELLESDYCVSFTGNAGPDTMEEKPAGLVYCSIASKKMSKILNYFWITKAVMKYEKRRLRS